MYAAEGHSDPSGMFTAGARGQKISEQIPRRKTELSPAVAIKIAAGFAVVLGTV